MLADVAEALAVGEIPFWEATCRGCGEVRIREVKVKVVSGGTPATRAKQRDVIVPSLSSEGGERVGLGKGYEGGVGGLEYLLSARLVWCVQTCLYLAACWCCMAVASFDMPRVPCPVTTIATSHMPCVTHPLPRVTRNVSLMTSHMSPNPCHV